VDAVINDHHYTNTSDETCAAVLDAGMVRWCACMPHGRCHRIVVDMLRLTVSLPLAAVVLRVPCRTSTAVRTCC
jgi:hypothetical protein